MIGFAIVTFTSDSSSLLKKGLGGGRNVQIKEVFGLLHDNVVLDQHYEQNL